MTPDRNDLKTGASPCPTPIIFFVFNRPDLTRLSFEAIARALPTRLLIIADGPRFPEEIAKCQECRRIVDQVNWECQVQTHFSDHNLGCKRRVISGFRWAFSQVEEAIILEDDCIPSQSFFRFCTEMLGRFREESRVTSISGCNLGYVESPRRGFFTRFLKSRPFSYRYTRFMNMWGWATWKRAFDLVDFEMNECASVLSSGKLRQILGPGDSAWIEYWEYIFDQTARGEVDTWDYQWIFSSLLRGGLTVSPRVNLIQNLGFRPDATHTVRDTHALANMEKTEIDFPLVHPRKFEPSWDYEEYIKCPWCFVCHPPCPRPHVSMWQKIVEWGLGR